MFRFTIEVPELVELDIDERRVEAAIADGARQGMRRKGLPRGQNLDRTTHRLGAEAAEVEIADQLRRSSTGGVRFRIHRR